MKEPKTFFLLLIPFFTICGSIYHIAYWDTFNINGLAFISVADIIKSAAYPYLTSFSLILPFAYIIGYVLLRTEKAKLERPEGKGKSRITIIFLVLLYIILIVLLIKYIGYLWDTPGKWTLITSLLPFIIGFFIYNTGFLSSYIPHRVYRYFIIMFSCLGPILAFGVGKFNSHMIYDNLIFSYVESSSNNGLPSDTLKLLGPTSSHYIFTDLNNKKTHIIRSEKIEILTLQQKINLSGMKLFLLRNPF